MTETPKTKLHINPDKINYFPGYKLNPPEVICECDLFGQRQMVISFHRSDNFPIPNRWIRFWTKVLFNSKWKFEK